MRELNVNEMEETTGGAWPAWAIGAGVVLVANHIAIPFVEGFIEEISN